MGACTAALAPLTALIQAHVLATARIHGDDTTVPVLARGKAAASRLRAYVRDDQPFGGPEPPAAVFHHSRDRRGEHAPASRRPTPGSTTFSIQGASPPKRAALAAGPLTKAGCPVSVADTTPWDRGAMAHGRRKLFALAQVARAPLAAEAVRRIDATLDVKRSINGPPAEQRLAVRQTMWRRSWPTLKPGCARRAAGCLGLKLPHS